MTVAIMQPQLPGAIMYALSGSRFIVWGSVSDHQYVEQALETTNEAFPTPILKRYPLIHIRLADVLNYCAYNFPAEGYFFSSTSGDLMVSAGPKVHEKIAKMLAEIDVENSDESRYYPVAYDISDIPVASHPYVTQAIRSISIECVILPTATPGFLVLYARAGEHKKIQEVVDEMLKDRPSATQSMVAYTVRRMTLPQLSQLLRRSIKRQDRRRHGVPDRHPRKGRRTRENLCVDRPAERGGRPRHDVARLPPV